MEDQERRARGVGYKEIAAAGGGILSSVRDVRGRSPEELETLTRARLHRLLAGGTTTVEVKSGYGLSLDAEIKQLEVIRALQGSRPHLVATFLGAHEVPAEHRHDRDGYVELVVREMLPAVERRGLARFCDVFCEPECLRPGSRARCSRPPCGMVSVPKSMPTSLTALAVQSLQLSWMP